jgi:4'-phosphopantetheinyl transferase
MERIMVEVYAVHVDFGMDISSFDPLLPCLTPERRALIGRFVHREDALRALTGDWLARTLMSARLKLPMTALKFHYDHYGKPHLPQGALHFNISHSGEWVAAAVGTGATGVDVEQVNLIDLDVTKLVFSPRERETLFSLPEGERLNHFYQLWTLKESLIKAVGKGFSMTLTDYTITFDKEPITLYGDLPDHYYFRQYQPAGGYWLAACSTDSIFTEELTILDLGGAFQDRLSPGRENPCEGKRGETKN